MATVHLGRLVGPGGFGRTVAIKRLHPHLAKEPEFVTMLTDEARVAGRIGHPNIVPTLDIVASEGELFLVMEYVPGLTLSALMKRAASHSERIPIPIVTTIMAGVLHGLHAVHEARDERGHHLEVVHRDVSPQNILVGTDGVARVLDFGIAKAAGRVHTTRDGQLKGKLGYMSPEQLAAAPVDRRTDIYAASVVLWEVLTGERLFEGDDAAAVFGNVMQKKVVAPSSVYPDIPAELDAAILRGLEREPSRRHAHARDMAIAIENAAPLARASEIGEWVQMIGDDLLRERAQLVADIEGQKSRAITAVLAKGDGTDGFLLTILDTPAGLRRRRRRTATVLVLGALMLALASVSAVVAARGTWRAPPANTSTVVLADTPTPVTITPVRDLGTAAPTSSTIDVVPPDPPPPPSASSPIAIVKTAKPRPPPPPPKPAPARESNCNPPFTIDEQGFKHYKLHCLK